jgi:hypothetical protein
MTLPERKQGQIKVSRGNLHWPDDYEERSYNALGPGEFLNETNRFLHEKGFADIQHFARSFLASQLKVYEGFARRVQVLHEQLDRHEHSEQRKYTDFKLDPVYVAVTGNGVVFLSYDEGYIKRNEGKFSHANPILLPLNIAGSSKAIDEVVTTLLADVKLVTPR